MPRPSSKPLFVFLLTSLFTLVGVFLSTPSTHAAIVFKSDYEGGNFSGWNQRANCCSYSQHVVPNTQYPNAPVRAGQHAARFELRDTDPMVHNGTRSEVAYLSSQIGNIGGSDEWYGFSIYLPPDFVPDIVGPYPVGETLVQWKDIPDQGETGRPPSLHINTQRDKWIIETRYSSKRIQTDAYDPAQTGQAVLWEAPFQGDRGVWTDFVVHVRWSCKNAPPFPSDAACQQMPAGFVEVWKNGQQIVDYQGPTSYNDQSNIFFKSGLYKAWWNNNNTTSVSTRILYNDELRIGDSTSCFNEVSPSSTNRSCAGGPAPTPSPTSVSCHRYTPSSTIPQGFGVPWDVFDPASPPVLITASCSSNGAPLSVNDPLNPSYPYRYAYKDGYDVISGQSSWTRIPLSGTGLISNTWYPGRATALIPLTLAQQSQDTYVVGYMCADMGTSWKCGCRDSACTQAYWQIQLIRR